MLFLLYNDHNATSSADMIDNELLQEMKALFIKSNKYTIKNIDQSMNHGLLADAHRLVHTLKSSALLIGQARLSSIAYEAEGLLKANTQLPRILFNKLEKELTRVLNELSTATQGDSV
ncbi:MAG: Hpt domain-containing protein [Defluviitaleaceae bacterium]|nr:Hpt domain-containing protein [Defluviitaleaceae bacterium]